tara:strand:- start:601 stop:720 length:120 start_codon:yes stop_codon:yes gene_type:complete
MSKTNYRGRLECQKNALKEKFFKKQKLTREQIDWITKKE